MTQLFSHKTSEQLQEFFKTNTTEGLTSKEAWQRLQTNGKNQIKTLTKITLWHQLKKQLKDFLVIILLMASTINFIIGIFQGKYEEFLEGCFILIIVFGNAFLSIYHENKTQKVLSLIEQKTSLSVKVIRDNQHFLIPIQNLVLGDIVVLEAGDLVPADIRLLQTFNLYVDESLFTGESQAVLKKHNTLVINKNIATIENLFASNMAFMKTIVLKGRAQGIVVAVGMQTAIGQITKSIANPQPEKTPLEKNLTKLIIKLTFIIGIIITFNALWVLLKNVFKETFNLNIFKNTFLDAIALAVAAIPEGLLIIMTLILVLGMKKMAVQKAIVKNLKVLETLGSVNIICTDKTGTLTQNNMTVKTIILADGTTKNIDYTLAFSQENKIALKKLILFGVLCNDALISYPNPSQLKDINIKTLEIFADPTEKALINLALFYQLDIVASRKKYLRIEEIPFDAQRKLMTTFHQKDGFIYAITKGAPEVLLQKCNQVENQKEIIAKTPQITNILENQINQLSQKSLRILGVAYRIFPLETKLSITNNPNVEQNLIFLGAVAMQDPIRQEVYEAINKCQKAYVTPIMITGDHLQTATIIAQKINILKKPCDLAITGNELNQMPEKEFLQKLTQIKVYARTSPHHKLKIVKAWQKKGFIVAMTGDGVNDALSIKQANIGIAMGMAGTHVAKVAADMILTDDNFATIVNALEIGRNIFNNIKKSLVFLLSCNIGEIILILLSNFLGNIFFEMDFQMLTAFQILWVNLVTDSLVAMALGVEKQEKNLMFQKPQHINKNLLDIPIRKKIMLEGLMIGILAFAASLVGYYSHTNTNRIQYAQTYSFMVLSLSQLVHVWNLRSFDTSVFKLKANPSLIKAFTISVFLQLILIVIPGLRTFFKLARLSLSDFMIILVLSLLPLFLIEIKKRLTLIRKRD